MDAKKNPPKVVTLGQKVIRMSGMIIKCPSTDLG